MTQMTRRTEESPSNRIPRFNQNSEPIPNNEDYEIVTLPTQDEDEELKVVDSASSGEETNHQID